MQQEAIKKLMPAVFQRVAHAGNPLSALLDVMETLHAPAEEVLGRIDSFFDPRQAPEEFVFLLSYWVDLSRIFSDRDASATDYQSAQMPKSGYLRELVANAAYLSRWRGTRKGLLLFLQIATGNPDFEIDETVADETGQIRPFHLRIRAPRAAEAEADLIRRIIESEKPVYVTYELEFKEQ